METRISLSLAVLLSAAVLLPLLGHKALADWDEGIYAEVSREFLRRGWLIPHWHFHPWFEKPPLALWITAAFFHIFGVNEFWARFGSALASIGIVSLIHAVALRLRGITAAWISTAILLSTFGFLRVARMGELDALLTLGCLIGLCGLAKVREGERKGWYWFWSGFAIAVMTKGAAAVTLLLALVVLSLWNRWSWRQFGESCWGGLAVFALLVLPWHLYMLHTFGGDFLHEYLGLHVITRATTQMEGHQTPWWFYGRVLLIYTSPWLLLFPFALWWQARRSQLREYLVFAIVVMVFFSAVATRSPKYIFPAYPALALLTGDWFAAHLEQRSRRFLLAAAVVTVAAFVGTTAIKKSSLGQSITTVRNAAGTVLHADREPETLLLAALRSPQSSGISGPILLWQEDTVAQLPSILFYVQRPLQQVYLTRYPDTLSEAHRYADPEPLGNFVGPTPRLILLGKPLAAEIPGDMKFTPLAGGNTFEAGTIQRR
ncbi:MAG TPA: glycosyltransferase family 39 protein [Silvibacterium sp.]|nr:glycosyltransferase family 39 protein [Silvibacterium sp.]